jgi:hypothetical protein
MRFARIIAVTGGGTAIALALGAASTPTALSQAAPGLWELSGVPGAKAPARECLMDVAALAQVEHRGKGCSRQLIRQTASGALFEYSCGGGDFGRSELNVITPRSLRVDTQGISGGLPFHYVLQARRIGDCAGRQTAQRH